VTADLASLTGIEVPTGLLIGGEWRPGSAGTLGVTDPATEDTLVEIANGTPEDAIAAVAAAHAALPGWAATPPRERAECLRRAWALMIERSEAIARLMVLENGKALRDARGEVVYAAEFFRWFAEEAVRIDGSVVTAPSGANRSWCCGSRSGSACWSRRGTSRPPWPPARSARRWRPAARSCSSRPRRRR
jgi:succinate-semialdehyde dehydrogenase/glutarate-semialdehyde dehydrogenase